MVNIQLVARIATPSDKIRLQIDVFRATCPQAPGLACSTGLLDAKEYWVLEQSGTITAALACPTDPEGVAWLRLFAHSSSVPLVDAWTILWETARAALQVAS